MTDGPLIGVAKARLTFQTNQRIFTGEASEPLEQRTPHPSASGIFVPGFRQKPRFRTILALGGRAVNTIPTTRKGKWGINPPVCLQVLNLPLTSGSSEAFCERRFNAKTEALMMTPADQRAQSAHAFQLSLLLEGHLAEMELYARLLFQTSQDLPVDAPGATAIHALHGAMRDRIACCWADYERLETLSKRETAA